MRLWIINKFYLVFRKAGLSMLSVVLNNLKYVVMWLAQVNTL